MKTVFNFTRAAALGAAALCALAAPASADTVYWSTRDLLADASFFRTSQRVAYRQIDVTAEQRARIEARLGYRLAHDRYTIFVATTDGRVDGYAVFDDELGQHMPITFA